jgi:hypothetical protein
MRRSDTQVGHRWHEDWPFQNDRLIPPNVLEAVNFYQTHGLIHGRRQIIPADPEQTNILGNFLWEYRGEPAECHGFSWRGRLLSKGHTEIECDRKVWLQVETFAASTLAEPGDNSGRHPRTGSSIIRQQLLRDSEEVSATEEDGARERTKPELLTLLSRGSGKSSPLNSELHFITNLLLQPRLSLRLLTRTCIK